MRYYKQAHVSAPADSQALLEATVPAATSHAPPVTPTEAARPVSPIRLQSAKAAYALVIQVSI